jgi:hypothetical protein
VRSRNQYYVVFRLHKQTFFLNIPKPKPKRVRLFLFSSKLTKSKSSEMFFYKKKERRKAHYLFSFLFSKQPPTNSDFRRLRLSHTVNNMHFQLCCKLFNPPPPFKLCPSFFSIYSSFPVHFELCKASPHNKHQHNLQ